jgi:sugar phosphate isomerase/epimerase
VIRPGLCSITFRGLSTQEIVRLAAGAGLSGIEWGADVHVPPGAIAEAESVASMCADAGIACPSYGSYLRAGSTDDATTGGHDAVFDTAVALGAGNVRVWSDWIAVADATADRRKAIADDLARSSAMAADRGLTISTEYHALTLTETAPSTLQLLVESESPPNLYTYWQPMDALDPGDNLDELARVRDHVSHLHVFWWANFAERFPLADGAALWPDAFALVDERANRWGADRYAFLEYVRGDDPAQLLEDAAALRSFLPTNPELPAVDAE